MKFVCYNNWDQLPESANALLVQGAKDCVFFSRPWFELLSSVLKKGQELALACVIDNDRVMAILPLMKGTGKSWYALTHSYTPHYSLLLANDNPQQVLTCLGQGLSQLPFSGLSFEPVANDDDKLSGLQRELELAGFNCNHTFKHYNWILYLQGQSYEEYMATRPARLRNTIARKGRKLEREHGYEIRLYTADDVPQHMIDYYAVYTASWKANEQYVDIVDEMVARFSKRGWTRLAVLYIKGQPAAAQLWLVHHGKASIFRLSYDKNWKQYSVGSILTSYLMKYVIDTDKVEEIDFLTGNDAYKQDWMSERRERYALGCVRIKKTEDRYRRFINSLKHILKSLNNNTIKQ